MYSGSKTDLLLPLKQPPFFWKKTKRPKSSTPIASPFKHLQRFQILVFNLVNYGLKHLLNTGVNKYDWWLCFLDFKKNGFLIGKYRVANCGLLLPSLLLYFRFRNKKNLKFMERICKYEPFFKTLASILSILFTVFLTTI